MIPSTKKALKQLLPLAILVSLAGLQPSYAQGVDTSITTNSLEPGAAVDLNTTGSTAFKSALRQIKDGQYLAAYNAARGMQDPVERRTIQWVAIRFGQGQVDPAAIRRFAVDAPHFDSKSIYKTRKEQSLAKISASHKTVINTLGGEMPNQIDAQIALAQAYVQDGQRDRARRITQSIWTNNFLKTKQENAVVKTLGNLLDNDDHWKRAVHLLMHDRASGTERIMKHLSAARQTLARARIAVSRKSKNAQQLIDKVDPSLRDHPLFHFTRGQHARDNGALKSAVAFLNKAHGDLPDSAEFWYERRLIVRRALAAGQPELAYSAAAGYKTGPEGRVVDANFHAGWIAQAYLNAPNRALPHFEKMRSLSTLSATITQSNFWIGRTQIALGNTAAARQAYTVAAQYGSEYYGILSREALGQKLVDIRALPEWRTGEISFNNLEMVRAVRLLAVNKQTEYAHTLMRRLSYSVSEPGHYVLAARLAQSINAHHLAILAADSAQRKGIPLDLFLYPKDGIPANAKLAKVDKAAVYAVTRQESKFDVDAMSGVGARGLMQLMPGTAKETAGKIGVRYSASKLTTDANYNVLLGSTYLAAQLKRYDGSLVLAAAAYNAGGGNVNKWIRAYGDPRKSSIDPISWVELIPFVETRKYVQRVMANYLVYNARLGRSPITMSESLRRIPN